MRVYIKTKRCEYDATGEYNLKDNSLKVLAGSIVSNAISKSTTFKGAKSIIKLREKYVKDNVVQEDVLFKSASTAANFITGASTNGLIAWKDKDGKRLNEYVK